MTIYMTIYICVSILLILSRWLLYFYLARLLYLVQRSFSVVPQSQVWQTANIEFRFFFCKLIDF